MPRLSRHPASDSSLADAPAAAADDAAVVARAKRDRREFAPLYRAYLRPVYGYCYRRLGDPRAAEDAAQHVFAQAIDRIATCQDASFRWWLFAIAHNVTANIVRGWRPSESLEAAGEIQDDGESIEDRAVDAELIAQLRRALDRLTSDQREVLALRFSGVSVHETASILRLTDGAVKQLQHRALLRLRSLMGLDPDGKEARHD